MLLNSFSSKLSGSWLVAQCLGIGESRRPLAKQLWAHNVAKRHQLLAHNVTQRRQTSPTIRSQRRQTSPTIGSQRRQTSPTIGSQRHQTSPTIGSQLPKRHQLLARNVNTRHQRHQTATLDPGHATPTNGDHTHPPHPNKSDLNQIKSIHLQ